ncbi:hypothetical protein CVT26_013550 [Gymnopilus dilepis]|uniref:Uncharacterized protein n=1 Tax=Gymnopilus dilepis TaxID=231916 RepID=A0A409X5N6_9AGAR|nr:hypothetical protein CVT26_013550 [Gymnopilus dilepis]
MRVITGQLPIIHSLPSLRLPITINSIHPTAVTQSPQLLVPPLRDDPTAPSHHAPREQTRVPCLLPQAPVEDDEREAAA